MSLGTRLTSRELRPLVRKGCCGLAFNTGSLGHLVQVSVIGSVLITVGLYIIIQWKLAGRSRLTCDWLPHYKYSALLLIPVPLCEILIFVFAYCK